MPNILFVSNNKPAIRDVYTKEQIGGCEIADYNDIVSEENDFSNIQYIFSTWGMPALSEDEIKKNLPALKAVFYGAGSVQNFARPFLNNGVKVFSAWAANAIPVAEYTVAQILLANKGYFNMQRIYREEGVEAARQYGASLPGNYNAKVGLLGGGMIGKYVIKLLKEYKLQIYLFDPFMSEETARNLGVEKTGLEYIFENCQTISNHLANNEQTKGMLNYSLFSKMKDNASFINTGRGAQLVAEDLVKAMKEKPYRTALIDVTDPTEPLPQDSIYWSSPNIYITPHRAGSLTDEIMRMGDYMIKEYESLISGGNTKYEVTLEMLKTMA